jgi:hypothetical protein
MHDTKKRQMSDSRDATDTVGIDELVQSFSRRVRVCECGASIPTNEKDNDEIGVCWTWLEESHPTVFDQVVHRGRPNGALFRSYVASVYRGLRLIRPDVISPLGTIDSIAGNCRAFNRVVDMFPCLFP